MTDVKEETVDASDIHDSPASGTKNGRTSLLDSGEDFEVLDDDDIGDEPPPLEDTGGGKGKTTDDPLKQKSDTELESPDPAEEWLDVLGL